MEEGLVYDRKIEENESSLHPEHRKISEWVGKNKNVLEIAPHTGYFSAVLKRNGCKVTGIELNEKALQIALPYLEEGILGNIEDEHIWQKIENRKYDVILFMHVLEHLLNPERVLRKAKNFLKDNGFIVVCLPNVSNWVERYNMFRGHFDYAESGIMDKTHLKFYNYFTAQQLLERNGFDIVEYFGGSWKVNFFILKRLPVLNKINQFVNIDSRYSSLINKVFNPNLTDRVVVFKAVGKDDNLI